MLRNEWGYEGLVMTDWWMQPGRSPDNDRIYDNAYRIEAQVDLLMPGEHPRGNKGDRSLLDSYASGEGISLGEMQRSAIHVLNYVMKSPAFRKANELEPVEYKIEGGRFTVKQEAEEVPVHSAMMRKQGNASFIAR
jgi:beta-glucosidase-like glycosyl hydrolase